MRRQRPAGTAAITALAALWCGAAQADAEVQNAPSIEACLGSAETIEAMRGCKRIVFATCLKEPENIDSTHGLVMCNSRELEA